MSRARRWFQIHLSTAIALMLSASVLLWANLHERSKFTEAGARHATKYFGWPYDAVWQREIYIPWSSRSVEPDPYRLQLFWNGAAADVGITVAVLAAVVVGCEWMFGERGT